MAYCKEKFMDIRRFKPIKQSRVSEEVAGQLKQSILLGNFKAGDRLPSERQLAEEFEVSRVAIREALRALGNAGFISVRQGPTGGAFVTELTFAHLADTYLDLFLSNKISIPELHQVRVLVEPEVARLAAQHVTDEYANRLTAASAAENLPPVALPEDIDRKQALHFILAEMCGNRFYEGLVHSMLKLTRQVVEVINPDPWDMHPGNWHVPVVKAVLSKNSEASYEAMRFHATEFGERLIALEKSFREENAFSGRVLKASVMAAEADRKKRSIAGALSRVPH